ncbi:MAG: right-handed parallel beta-helix repeat-containing protein, partial [Desulfobacterales bacterium]|nr:right-handed parallel beta-helix repeat-containing protein [Desulfobacterales bacterium]
IRDNTDNHGTAAAIHLEHFSPATLRGNAISRTRSHAEYGGCAIILDFFSNARIEGNIIADNLGDGIFTLIDSSPEVINNIISGNGGGLNTSTGHPLLINNTVVDNLGNGIYARDIANVTITNNIFSNDFEIGSEAFSHVDVTYSYVKGGRVGEGNISGDPMFVGDGDYRLEEGSPCIDAGASVNAPADDISGTTRPRGAGYDMGAYEYQVAPGPDIKANDQDGPISVAPGSHVSITVSLDPGGYAGQNADWWLVELAPDGHLYYFDLAIGSMAPGISPTHRGALFSLGSAPVFNVSNLTSGSHTFYFGVDLNGNGLPDMDALYYDGVSV